MEAVDATALVELLDKTRVDAKSGLAVFAFARSVPTDLKSFSTLRAWVTVKSAISAVNQPAV